MNKHVHRLVFDRRRGMRVPAAEHVRASGKAAGGEGPSQAPVAAACSVLMLSTSLALLMPGAAMAQRSIGKTMQRSANQAATRTINRLPVLSTAPDRIAGNRGAYTVDDPLATGGTVKTITQSDRQIIINWDSFDIAKGYTVKFVQPTNGSALNNIWSNDPSVILGNIQANAEVILQNQNGVIFGPTARVETGRFVATALRLADDAFQKGLRANLKGEAIFGDDAQSSQGFITIERGAEIKALAGGDVIMVAPKIYNEGRIETPSGQTVLAAGKKVYLYSSDGSAGSLQRGLIVAVDPFTEADGAPEGVNTVEQAEAASYKTINGETVSDSTPDNTVGLVKKINQVVAEQGTINLVGMTVRQNGVLSATTAVKGQNGGIYLQAQKSTYQTDDTKGPRLADELGTVELGSQSITSVTPSASSATQYSAETFNRSRINIEGKDIRVRSGALVQAVSGNIQVRAAESARSSQLFFGTETNPDNSSLVVESGAILTAAGLRNVLLPMSRNQLTASLFQIELADSPVQRNGVVYRKTIAADARRQVKFADVTGYYNLIGRTAQELSTRGGNIMLASRGTTVVADGAKLNISGGSVKYEAGQVVSSTLSNGQGLVSIEDADPMTRYTALFNPAPEDNTLKTTASYVEGADAGHLSLLGSTVYLGADIQADAVIGPLQRSGALIGGYDAVVDKARKDLPVFLDALGWSTTLKASPWLYASLRPKGGTVSIGKNGDVKELDQIDVVAQPHRAVTQVPEAGTEEAAAFYASLGPTQVSAKSLQASGVGELILAAKQVNMAADAKLNLGASGRFEVDAERGINLAGEVRGEGGRIALASQGAMNLADSAVLDVSGRQADERRNPGTDAVNVNGGSVSISSGLGSSLDIRGAEIDVSGGYWLSVGSTIKGTAGDITLSVGTVPKSTASPGKLLMDGATLSGYDFATGGTLTLQGMRTVSIGTVPATEQVQWSDGLQLSADFFSQGGFGKFNLSAVGDVAMMDNTQLLARKKNLFVPVATSKRASAMLSALSPSVQTLEDGLRSGVSIGLTASAKPDKSIGVEPYPFQDGGSIRIGKNALVDVGAGGGIDLKAGLAIEVEGTLRARGGQVSLKLDSSERNNSQANPEESTDVVGYIENQEIRLKDHSQIDVSGIAKVVNSVTGGRQTGLVLGGGSVNLNYTEGSPSRGRVVTEVGSLINVSGAAADLNLSNSIQKTRVSQGAGSLMVGSADGFFLQGNLQATRPDVTVAGGAFLASLSREGGNDVVNSLSVAQGYPVAQRNIVLLGTADDVSDHLKTAGLAYGEGVLSSAQLLEAGFDRVTLRSDQLITLGRGANLVGDKVPLRSVSLTSRELAAGDDATHAIKASYVSLGNKDLYKTSQAINAAASVAGAGHATLKVDAGLIEVHGYSALKGFETANLAATLSANQQDDSRTNGEIRFIGSTFGNSTVIAGQFNFDAALTLQAGAIYTNTLSTYTVQGASPEASLTVLAPEAGSTSTAPLSALGNLNLKAHDITIDGTLYQPFGKLTIEADHQLSLGSHAMLSVSGDGLVVPVGSMINGTKWVYSTVGTADGVTVGAPTTQVLDDLTQSKSITLKGATELSVNAKATLAAQTGGDLQAWETVFGVGGSTDVLKTAGYYAIVPSYQYDFAPHDTEVAITDKQVNGSALAVGSQVTITTANGVLKPGTYTLLPAQYALLPGAVLVSSETLAQGQKLAKAVVNDDGSVLVSGYQTTTGTSLGSGTAGAALVLAPRPTVLARTQYDLTSINDYLVTQAEAKGTRTKGLPSDAGRISLGSNDAFDFAAKFKLQGGELDLWMGDKMAVVADGAKAPEGYAVVDVDAIESTGARSVLLGGTRDGENNNTKVTALATDVLWATSVDTKSELITVAKERVQVADGLTLGNSQAANAEAQTITLKGPSAALVLTNRIDTTLARSGVDLSAPLTGSLVLGQGVTLSGTAVQLDGLKSVALGDGTAWQAQSIGLGARGMLLGAKSADASVLSLTGDLLASLTNVQRLQLRSYDSIDIAGSLAIGTRDDSGKPILQSLVIDAPQVRGVGLASDQVVITAREVLMRNAGGSPVGTGSGAGSLKIVSEPALNDTRTGGTTIAGGAQHLAFQNVTLESKGDVVLDGSGSLSTQGDLTVKAARLTATTGANHALTSGGVLTIAKSDGAHTLGESRGAGANIKLQGQQVIQAGRVEMASAKLAVTGTGQHDSGGQLKPETVVFEKDSVTSTKGLVTKAGTSWAVSAPGGDIAVTADVGQVVIHGELDVSSAGKASDSDSAKSAGTLTLKAIGAQGAVVLASTASLKGSADTDTLSGKLVLDTKTLAEDAPVNASAVAVAAASKGTLDRLVNLANAGQMHGGVNLRLREGNQSLDTTLKAVRAVVGIDQGSLTLLANAVVDAKAPQGGVVTLAARDDLVLSTGSRITADSSRAGANGGDVLLSSAEGTVSQQTGASVSAVGDAGDKLDGRIVLRAGINLLATDESDPDHSQRVRLSLADAGLMKAGDVTVESVKVYELSEEQAGNVKAVADTLSSDADAFMANAGQIANQLGLDKIGPGAGHVRFGAELRSEGDLGLAEAWNLAELRPGGEPIALTIRAGGNLNIKGHLSDGFALAGPSSTPARSATQINPGDAASYRLVAGADTGAANPMAVLGDPGQGSLIIGSGKVVRTTSGSIEMAAAGDVVLEAGTGANPVQAVAYVAGRLPELKTSTTTTTNTDGHTVEVTSTEYESSSVSPWVQFTDHGGRLEVYAGKDVTAPGFTQLIGNWLYHAGNSAGAEAWGSSLDTFKQGFGSFGGGNIRVEANGSVKNVGVVAPTSARYITTDVTTRVTNESGEEISTNTVGGTRWAVDNGGDVTVKAGGDILGGVYLLSRGQGLIEAGGALAKGTAYDPAKLAAQDAIVGLMGGQWTLQARGDLSLGLVYNPTILNTPAATRSGTQGLYYTYDQDGALNASSTAGDLAWSEENGAGLTSTWHNVFAPAAEKITFANLGTLWPKVALVAPPTMRLQSLVGDLTVTVGQDVTLFPSATGDLSLFAASDLLLQNMGKSRAVLQLADTAPSSWPAIGHPLGGISQQASLPLEIAGNASPLMQTQTGSQLHANDAVPVRIHAGDDLTLSAISVNAGLETNYLSLVLPKPAEIVAGGNLINPLISVQHFDDQDVSVVEAGKNVQGGIAALNDKLKALGITVAGPGELQVTAGQNLNLNASNGILSIGNAKNDQLPEENAQLRLMAGQARSLQFDAFASKYLSNRSDVQAQLIAHVKTVLNLDKDALTGEQAYAEALGLFRSFSTPNQVAFADKVMGQDFVAAYVADGRIYAAEWAKAAAKAGVSSSNHESQAFRRFKDDVLMAEVVRLGQKAVNIADSTDAIVNAQRQAERNAIWSELKDAVSLAGMGEGFKSSGNIDLAASTVQTLGKGSKTTGGIDLLVPHGDVIVGLANNTSTGGGMITYGGGAMRAVLDGEFQVNSQKAFVVGTGDLTVYSVNGAIDSGRGSNTTVSVPPTTGKLVDGYMTFQLGAVTSGSGIGILTLPDGKADGDINLFAPVGGILALDTFIRNQAGSGSTNLGGPVKGGDNIKGGNVKGAPLVVAAGPALSAPSTLPGDTAAGTEDLANRGRDAAKGRNGILTVDLLSMGDGGEATAAGAPAEPANPAKSQECKQTGKACSNQP